MNIYGFGIWVVVAGSVAAILYVFWKGHSSFYGAFNIKSFPESYMPKKTYRYLILNFMPIIKLEPIFKKVRTSLNKAKKKSLPDKVVFRYIMEHIICREENEKLYKQCGELERSFRQVVSEPYITKEIESEIKKNSLLI